MDNQPIKIYQQLPKSPLLPAKIQDIHQFEVVCRLRPLAPQQHISDIAINEEKSTITIISQTKNQAKQFFFNKIYNENVSQRQFTAELSEKIFKYCLQTGKTALIFSYGVTNSGKTYSILGTQENPGLLPSLIEKIEVKYPEDPIRITAIEIYNDEFYSLKNKQKLCPRERGAFYQFDQYQPQQITKESTSEMMKQYIINRYQSDTKSNKKSSRSHAIFKIENDQISIAVVDLAGSERIHKAETNPQETASINLSLLTLGKCIHAIRDRTTIPFRQSKLTRAIVQYFTPQSKIYMIAHINRSGQMYHENVTVLQYAAASTQVKQINPLFNHSIIKSAKKRNAKSKSKSVLKAKDNSKENSPKNREDGKKEKVPKSAKLHKDNQVSAYNQKLAKFDQKQKLEYQRKRKRVMEDYINRLKAQKEEFDFYLDCQFQKEDSKDLQFIQELKKARYNSPERKTQINIQLCKAESRVKLRKEILNQIQRQKRNNQCDAQTEMGPSMRKCLQQSILRERQRHSKSQQLPKNRQLELRLGETNQIDLNAKSDHIVREEISKFQSTPHKGQQNYEEQSQNYLGKLWQKSKKIFATAGQTFNNVVVQYIRSHSKKKQKPKQRPKLAIHKQMQIYIEKCRQKEKQIRASRDTQITFEVKPEVTQSEQSIIVPSQQSVIVNSQQSEAIKLQQISIVKSDYFEAVKSQVLERSADTDLLNCTQTQSTALEEQSLLLGNYSREYASKEKNNNLAAINQTQEFKHEINSPYFKNVKEQISQPKKTQQINIVKEPVIAEQKKPEIVTQNIVYEKAQKDQVETKLEQSVSGIGSDWDQETSKGSVFSHTNPNPFLPQHKNDKRAKSKKNREIKLYVEQPNKKKSISPLKTRSQKLKSQSRPKF